MKYYMACIESSRTLSNWIKISKINFAVDRFVHTCAKCNEDNQNDYFLYYVSIAMEYNFSAAVLAEMKHLALDLSSCRCHVSGKLNDIQKLQDNVRDHAREIDIFTLTLGSSSIWFGHVEKRLEQWREEVVQRDLVEMVIPRIRRHSRAYGWSHGFQVEYKIDGKVVFCEGGEKLQEYQGAFRFDPDLRQFLG
jgi:hypothetical protein